MATPYSLQVREEVPSTQDLAAAAFSGHPVLVAAARQTEGRGRSNRSWETAPRALAASLAFLPAWPPSFWPAIPLVAGLAAAEVLGDGVGIKWPNDLLVGADKVGGILVEGSADYVVVGCGVNLWWPDPPTGVVGWLEDDPGPDRFSQLGETWAARLLVRMSSAPEDWGHDEYIVRCVTVGKEITWEPRGAGAAVDVDEQGALVVRTAAGLQRLVAGEVRHIRARSAERGDVSPEARSAET